MEQKLIPELDVSDLQVSLSFYLNVVGCTVLYDRPEERFSFLDLEGAQFMLEEAGGPGRRFRTAPLERPFGRGVNFQIQVSDVGSLYGRIVDAAAEIIVPLEERWYRHDHHELGNRQFVVADPDGFILRFFTDLGSRLRT